eukprot:s2886_g10.t1
MDPDLEDAAAAADETAGAGNGRRVVLPDGMVENILMLVEWLIAMALSIPMVLVILLSLTMLLARAIDLFGYSTTDYVWGAVFGHLKDPCDQPLGGVLLLYWCIVLLRLTLLYSWVNCFEGGCLTTASCWENPSCQTIRFFLYTSVVFLTLVFEVSWPCTTFTMLLLARKCTWQLRVNAWVLLCPYLLQLLGLLLWLSWLQCLRLVLRRSGLRLDPSDAADAVRRLQSVPYDAELFSADGISSTCAICLSDFTAADTAIVLAPCGETHLFHRSCLADWVSRTATCPLCRRPLAGLGRNDLRVEEVELRAVS